MNRLIASARHPVRLVVAPICDHSIAGRALACIALGTALVATSRIGQAAPLSFAFEAIISEVQGDVAALNLPFSLATGQQLTGAIALPAKATFWTFFFIISAESKESSP
jgi:hypothetical protein